MGSLPIFLIELSDFLLLSFRRSLYILDINPLFWILTQIFFNRKIFFLFCRLPFTLLIVPFDAQKFLSLM